MFPLARQTVSMDCYGVDRQATSRLLDLDSTVGWSLCYYLDCWIPAVSLLQTYRLELFPFNRPGAVFSSSNGLLHWSCFSDFCMLARCQRQRADASRRLCDCTVYSVHFTVYSVHCTFCTVHCTLYTVHCTLYSVQCADALRRLCTLISCYNAMEERRQIDMDMGEPGLRWRL